MICLFIKHSDYQIEIVKEIDSTNTYLKNHYRDLPDKYVLLAKKQLNGRGRFEHKWVSNGDLTFSILSKRNLNYKMIIPVSVLYALRFFYLDPQIKWPNDLYIENRKISGILIEDIYEGNSFNSSVIGIGINLFDKKEFNGVGVSSFTKVDKIDLLKKVLDYLDYFEHVNNQEIIELFVKNNLAIGKRIKHKDKLYVVKSISEEGYLVCISMDNTIVEFGWDEITLEDS